MSSFKISFSDLYLSNALFKNSNLINISFFEGKNSNFSLINIKINNFYVPLLSLFSTNTTLTNIELLNHNYMFLSTFFFFIINSITRISFSKILKLKILNEYFIYGMMSFFNSVIFINNCIFSYNEALYGGALYIFNSNVTIKNSFFLENKANFGGSIFFNCSLYFVCVWNLKNNNFSNNEAKSAGGAYFWINFKILDENTNIFLNNKAASGINFATPPLKLLQYFENEEEKNKYDLLLKEYLPGDKMNVFFCFKLIDYYNQHINYPIDGKLFVEIFRSNKINYNIIGKNIDLEALIIGETLINFNLGFFLFKFHNFKIHSNNNNSIILDFHTNLINCKNNLNINYQYPHYCDDYQYHNLLYIDLKDCPLGIYFFKKIVK